MTKPHQAVIDGTARCDGCVYYVIKDPWNETLPYGKCRFHAPHQTTGSGTGWANWDWPDVMPESFCGEFYPREKGE